MATFHRDPESAIYVFAIDKGKAKRFARKKGLTNYVTASRIEDFPRERHLTVVLVGEYWLNEDYDLLFTEGGFLFNFRATIFYDSEIHAVN